LKKNGGAIAAAKKDSKRKTQVFYYNRRLKVKRERFKLLGTLNLKTKISRRIKDAKLQFSKNGSNSSRKTINQNDLI